MLSAVDKALQDAETKELARSEMLEPLFLMKIIPYRLPLLVKAALQEDIEGMLSAVDKALHGAETGELEKAVVKEALDAFFLVGQPRGKTLNRFNEVMQVESLPQHIPFINSLAPLP